jgi:hypothetical protein
MRVSWVGRHQPRLNGKDEAMCGAHGVRMVGVHAAEAKLERADGL